MDIVRCTYPVAVFHCVQLGYDLDSYRASYYWIVIQRGLSGYTAATPLRASIGTIPLEAVEVHPFGWEP